MEDLSQKERIKQRDRWACRLCNTKFVKLTTCKFGKEAGDDNFISLCNTCLDKTSSELDKYVPIFKAMLRHNKVILIGDCHGHFEKLDEVLTAEEPFDFFISVGDVGSLSDVTPQNIGVIDRWQKGYFVRGNHDDVQFFSPLGLSQSISGINVAGLNGLIRNRNFAKDTPNNISFREILYLSHQRDIDILVTHQAPTGIFNGVGEPVLEELLNYVVPKIYVFGHVHKYKLKFHLQTFVISLPMIQKGYAVAYFQGRDLKNIEIIFKKGKKVIRV